MAVVGKGLLFSVTVADAGGAQLPLVTVQVSVALAPVMVACVKRFVASTKVADPVVTDQRPVPGEGLLPLSENVAVLHNVWLGPALIAAAEGRLKTITSSELGAHTPLVMVQVAFVVPVLPTIVFGFVEADEPSVPGPPVMLHAPIPLTGVLPVIVNELVAQTS